MPSRPLAPPSPGPRCRRDVLLAVVVASFSALLLAFLLLFCLYRSFAAPTPATPPSPSTPPSPPPSAASPSVTSTLPPPPSTPPAPSAATPPPSSFTASSPTASLSPSNASTTPPPPPSRPPLPKPPPTASSTTSSTSSPPSPLPPCPFVVFLLGYCLDSPHCRLLIYEYMPNGSLQDALFSSSDHHLVLSWDRRFDIILDVAQALTFLSWDRRLGSGLGARLARQATQTGTMRGRTHWRTTSIPGIRAKWRDWTVGRTPFSRSQGSMPPSGSRRRNRRRPSTVEIRRIGK